MDICEIRAELLRMRDPGYRDLQITIIPTLPPESFIGVRTPQLRDLARTISRSPDAAAFLASLPHRSFEENQLHAFIISEMKDFDMCVESLTRFLPWVDNWATCDQMSPRVFRRHRADLLPHIRVWITSGKTYTVRFAIGMLMTHFLDEDFDPSYPEMAAAVPSDEYSARMMIAWYFATALAKQYDAVLPYITERRLPPRTHDMTISKAVESFRISPERKAFLKTQRIGRTKL